MKLSREKVLHMSHQILHYLDRDDGVEYFDEPQDTAPIESGADVRWLLSANGLAVLILGVMPGGLMALCLAAMQNLYPLAR